MTAPKVETIVRHCDNHLAIKILHDRRMLTDDEAADLHARAHADTDVAYEGVYGRSREPIGDESFAELGRAAFKAGVPSVVPREILLDAGKDAARAWYRGWDRANLAAPWDD